MNFDQIIALVNAGYTKAEIDAMQTPAAPAAPEPAADQAPAPAPAPADPTPAAPEPSAPAQPAQQPAQTQPTEYERLEALLNRFIGVAQAGNLNAGMSAGIVPQRTATDILGEVIAPPMKGAK